MPAVAEGVADDVDGIAVEHLVHVGELGELLVLETWVEIVGRVEFIFIAVADGDDFDVVFFHLHEGRHVGTHATAEPEEADTDSIVGTEAALGQGRCGDGCHTGDGGRGFEEGSSAAGGHGRAPVQGVILGRHAR